MLRIIIWKQPADVRFTQRAKQGICDRVIHRIAVAVSNRPERMVKCDAAESEWPTGSVRRDGFQPMQVVAMSDALSQHVNTVSRLQMARILTSSGTHRRCDMHDRSRNTIRNAVVEH